MKYSYNLIFSDGEVIDGAEDDEIFATESEAVDAALYSISCYHQGCEIDEMSNPGDFCGESDVDYEIYEIDD